MNKTKTMIIAICAVLVVAGAAVAIPMLRNRDVATKPEETLPVTDSYMTVDRTELPDESQTITETIVEELTDAQGNAVTSIKTIKETVKNTATTKASSKSTTKKRNSADVTYAEHSDTGVWYVDAIGRGLTSMEQKAVLGYSYNSEGDYFYTDDKDCWQAGFGYNEVYDQMAPMAVMFIDEVRIRFDYEGKAWMIQLWKGQYGWIFVGAEIGVYTANGVKTAEIDKNDINHYDCASQSDWLNMRMTVLWDDDRNGSYKEIFTREYTKYWWATGFKFGTLNRFSTPITELKMDAQITFKSAEMASLFTRGMKSAGFSSASSADSLSKDTIFQDGANVYFDWVTKHDDAYVDYVPTTKNNPASTTTTIPVKED